MPRNIIHSFNPAEKKKLSVCPDLPNTIVFLLKEQAKEKLPVKLTPPMSNERLQGNPYNTLDAETGWGPLFSTYM